MTRRDISIIAKVRAGATLTSVGEECGITRERVRQICKKAGVMAKRFTSLQGAPCSVRGCERRAKYRTSFGDGKPRPCCIMHIQRIKRLGYPGPAKSMTEKTTKSCKAKGCTKIGNHGRGYCATHYSIWRYHNVPGVKEAHRAHMKAYHNRRMATDPTYKAHYLAYQKAWRARRKTQESRSPGRHT